MPRSRPIKYINDIPHKQCSNPDCERKGEWLSCFEFYIHSDYWNLNGLASRCIKCEKEYRQSPRGKEIERKYNQCAKRKQYLATYVRTEAYNQYQAEYRENKRKDRIMRNVMGLSTIINQM